MKTKIFLLTAFFITQLISVNGQEKRYKFFYIETGMDFISCAPPDDKDYIRGDMYTNTTYYDESSYMMSLLYKNYVGVKAEVKLQNGLLGLTGGLRLTRIESSLGKDNYWSTGTDFLYLLYQQNGTTTEYLKVKDITQVSNYFGIPLELKIYPYEDKAVQIYYKIGADFNVLIHSKTNTRFFDPAMEQYENRVDQVVEDPWPVYSSIHLAAGLKIGKPEKPGINIEACAPAFIIADFKSSFVDPIAGGGIQLNIRIPF